MEQFKRAQVVMLDTQNDDFVFQLSGFDILSKNNGGQRKHLYIISDDEIKEGDLHITSDHSGFGFRKYKIIATTDTSLKIFAGKGDICDLYYNLPQPSQQFIEKYIESYNKGEVITEVLVEYEDYDWDLLTSGNTTIHQRVKVNPKDNTITIKKLKDSWNREEMINIIKKVYYDAEVSNCGDTVDKWIKENL